MKKAVFICIIPLLLILFVGVFEYAFFLSAKTAIRKELKHKIKQGISNERLHHFAIKSSDFLKNKADIQWLDKGKEVKIKGRLYDVIRTQTEGTNMVLFLLDDVKEMNLMQMLDHYLGSKSQSPAQKLLKEIFQLKYLPLAESLKLNCFERYFYLSPVEFNSILKGFPAAIFHPPLV